MLICISNLNEKEMLNRGYKDKFKKKHVPPSNFIVNCSFKYDKIHLSHVKNKKK